MLCSAIGAMHGMLGRPEPELSRMRASSHDERLEKYLRAPVSSSNISMQSPDVLGEQTGGNVNHFAYLTSGFHSVNESYLKDQCEAVLAPADPAAVAFFYSSSSVDLTFLDIVVRAGDISRDYDDLMSAFRAAFFDKDTHQQDHLEHVIFLRKIAEVWNIPPTLSVNDLSGKIKEKVQWLMEEYLPNHRPGDSIPK